MTQATVQQAAAQTLPGRLQGPGVSDQGRYMLAVFARQLAVDATATARRASATRVQGALRGLRLARRVRAALPGAVWTDLVAVQRAQLDALEGCEVDGATLSVAIRTVRALDGRRDLVLGACQAYGVDGADALEAARLCA